MTDQRSDSAIKPCALTIAGSDSGGGAGIQADLKAFRAVGVHGLCAITALTAQNLRGVTAVGVTAPALIHAQIDAVFDEFDIRAIKIGMLADTITANTVADALDRRPEVPVVLDPVMVATSGATLLERDTVSILRERLIPRAALITPNLPEAEILLGRTLAHESDLPGAAAELLELGAQTVLLKGGHLEGGTEIVDILHTKAQTLSYRHPRLPFEAHGTGCTLSSAIAAHIALGDAIDVAVAAGIADVQNALLASYRLSDSPTHVLGI